METTTTEPTVERTLVTGGDPDAPFKVPVLFGDFRDAPELARIGDALIQACEEFEDLKWAIDEDGFEIAYVWRKKAAKSADRIKAGTLGKAAGLAKHFATEAKGSPVGYVVAIAADANYGQTNWQMEALVFHELMHCKVARKTVGKGEDKHTVPVLKVKAHDLEVFWAERQRYGDWRYDLKKGREEFAQSKLPMNPPTKASKPYDPAVDQAPGVEDELGPVDGGAPGVDWAETFKGDPDMMELIDAGLVVKAGDPPLRFDAEGTVLPADWPEDADDELAEELGETTWADGIDPDDPVGHRAAVRANFTTEIGADGGEVCSACGLAIDEHDSEVCQGGTPQTRAKNGRSKNGKHDADGPILDSAKVIQTLSEGRIELPSRSGT